MVRLSHSLHILVNVNRIEPATSPALNPQFLYFTAGPMHDCCPMLTMCAADGAR